MANSSIIGKAKNEIIKALINDNAIINAIEPDGIGSKEDLINNYIFNFHQNPNTINEVKNKLQPKKFFIKAIGVNIIKCPQS